MKYISIIGLLFIVILYISFNSNGNNKSSAQVLEHQINKAKVTIIELGSVNCIPCKMMQPVMKNIEKNYGSQVKVVFYDVWTQEQRQYAEQYKIRVIPTQVFLDENGKEFHRHVGFYPEEEIDKILKSKGLKLKNSKG